MKYEIRNILFIFLSSQSNSVKKLLKCRGKQGLQGDIKKGGWHSCCRASDRFTEYDSLKRSSLPSFLLRYLPSIYFYESRHRPKMAKMARKWRELQTLYRSRHWLQELWWTKKYIAILTLLVTFLPISETSSHDAWKLQKREIGKKCKHASFRE